MSETTPVALLRLSVCALMAAVIGRRFRMRFNPTTIEHLGLKLYASLPPVIGEVVSNAWDADATVVDITFPEDPTEDAEVVVKDDGIGMTADELQEAYLQIGRNRRAAEGTDKSPRGRVVTGRKGLGKLAAFGVADELEIRAVRAGQAICIRLNYEDMKAVTDEYEPQVVTERSGSTGDPDGTEVRVRHLRRKRKIETPWIRRELARRFTLIGDDFLVRVNGEQVVPSDRRLRADCERSWEVTELPNGALVDEAQGWTVRGWVGFIRQASQKERGIDLFARGKAVELGSMFGLATTHAQFPRAYVVGEVHADFLDAEEDLITTARTGVQWDSTEGSALQRWGEEALKFVFAQWNAVRREAKEREIKAGTDFGAWLETRTPRERKIAMKIVNALIDDPNIDAAAARPLVDVVKTNIEFTAFQELVDEIEDAGGNVQTLLRLVDDWRLIEARELFRVGDGRLSVMKQLDEYIERGALEVQEMQPLFEQNPWLIDPTWTTASAQTTYTKMLREKFPDGAKAEEERRIDLLGVTAGQDLHIVELKRPEKTLSYDDLVQIERYVTWARANVAGSGPAPRVVHGRLIVGKLGSDAQVKVKRESLVAQGIEVFTYDDLLHQARTVYGWLEKSLKKIAPEYAAATRRAPKKAAVAARSKPARAKSRARVIRARKAAKRASTRRRG